LARKSRCCVTFALEDLALAGVREADVEGFLQLRFQRIDHADGAVEQELLALLVGAGLRGAGVPQLSLDPRQTIGIVPRRVSILGAPILDTLGQRQLGPDHAPDPIDLFRLHRNSSLPGWSRSGGARNVQLDIRQRVAEFDEWDFDPVSMPARIRSYLLMFGLTAALHGSDPDCPGRP
jgi:hypothetical protein